MKQSEIWLVDFSPRVGQGIDKVRPGIIVNHDSIGALELKVVVPVTDPARSIRDWHFSLSPTLENGLSKESIADCFQIKLISHDRFFKRLGKLSQKEMEGIKLTLMTVLDLF
jgi:mRNA interferase MazF